MDIRFLVRAVVMGVLVLAVGASATVVPGVVPAAHLSTLQCCNCTLLMTDEGEPAWACLCLPGTVGGVSCSIDPEGCMVRGTCSS